MPQITPLATLALIHMWYEESASWVCDLWCHMHLSSYLCVLLCSILRLSIISNRILQCHHCLWLESKYLTPAKKLTTLGKPIYPLSKITFLHCKNMSQIEVQSL